MALLWFDGFETYSGYADYNAIEGQSADSHVGCSASYGRRGGRGISTSGTYYFKKEFTNTEATIIMGAAFYKHNGSTPTYSSSVPLYNLGGHVGIYAVGEILHVYNMSGVKLAETSGHVLTETGYTWYYIEVKVTISDTVGQVTIRVNEHEVLSTAANLDTRNGAGTAVEYIEFNGPSPGNSTFNDDFYICDITGSKNNDFLGDIRVDPLRPKGAGNYTDFDPSAGSNYENVDETYPDDDTTYNDSQDVAAGEQDSYDMESLDVLGSVIHGVKDQITVRKTDSGNREAKILTRQGGSDYLGDTIILSDTFTTHARIMENNPDDAAAFVEADITAGEVGVEVTV